MAPDHEKFITSITVPIALWKRIEHSFLMLKDSGRLSRGMKRNAFLVDLLSKGIELTDDGGPHGA